MSDSKESGVEKEVIPDSEMDDFFEDPMDMPDIDGGIKIPEPKPIDKDLLDRVHAKIKKMNEFAFVPSEMRNVLLCGRTRSGKTTAMAVLKDPTHNPEGMTLFSGTRNTHITSFSIKDRTKGKLAEKHPYTINIIDTPGLFEQMKASDLREQRTNETITGLITKCLESEINYLNAVFLFLSVEGGGITEEDIKSIITFLELFDSKDCVICLVITRAELKGKQWRKDIFSQICRYKKLAGLVRTKRLKVKFMGAVDVKSGVYKSFDQLKVAYSNVYYYRKNFLRTIFDAKSRAKLSDLQMTKSNAEKLKKRVEKIKKSFDTLATYTEAQFKENIKVIEEHKEDMKYLGENRSYLSFEDIFKVSDLQKKIFNFARIAKCSDALKRELTQPLEVDLKKLNK